MRKTKPKKRIMLPDPKYNDPYVTRFVNNLMFSGKKNLAFKIFYDSLDIIGDKFKSEGKSPLEIFKQALDNVTPQVEVKARRVGGATFQVPMERKTASNCCAISLRLRSSPTSTLKRNSTPIRSMSSISRSSTFLGRRYSGSA